MVRWLTQGEVFHACEDHWMEIAEEGRSKGPVLAWRADGENED